MPTRPMTERKPGRRRRQHGAEQDDHEDREVHAGSGGGHGAKQGDAGRRQRRQCKQRQGEPELGPARPAASPGDQLADLAEQTVAEVGRHLDLQPVRQHPRAAEHRRPVAATFTDDRSQFAGNRGFVHLGHAVDHLAVDRDDVAGLHQHDIADVQRFAGHRLVEPVLAPVVRHDQALGRDVALQPAQAPRSREGTGLRRGHARRQGEQGQPEPECHLPDECGLRPVMAP